MVEEDSLDIFQFIRHYLPYLGSFISVIRSKRNALMNEHPLAQTKLLKQR